MTTKQIRTTIFALTFLVLGAISSNAQTSTSFNEVAQQIERLLQYKDKSPTELRKLIGQLERLSNGNELAFKQIKMQVEHYLLPLEIKSIKSTIYNKDYQAANSALSNLKKNYTYSKDIEKLEKSLNTSMFKHYKKIILKDIHPRLSLEPSYTWFSQDYTLEGIDAFEFVNFTPVYSLSLNYHFRFRESISAGNSSYNYSQMGIRYEFRDDAHLYYPLNPSSSITPNQNLVFTTLWGQFLGLDFGMYQNLNTPLYNGTLNVNIPLGGLSVGAHARVITDFNQDPTLQLGASARLSFKFFRPFNSKHKEEIEMRILRFKESI
jgi:hypothetical protein